MSRRVLNHNDRADLEKQITRDIGEFLDDANAVADNIAYTWDSEKGVIIAEKYSALGNVIEFYEVRPVVSYVGDGAASQEEQDN